MFIYDVGLHFPDGWDTYEVKADCVDNARFVAVERVINEINRKYANLIDCKHEILPTDISVVFFVPIQN